jgi:hypothetical protein
MPEEKTIKRARKDKRQGKAPSTQAGEFVREASSFQGRIMFGILKHDGHQSASMAALSRQARAAAQRKTVSKRSVAVRKAVHKKGPARLSAAAKKPARTRRS